jgi:cytochrome c oxidase subunit 4
MRDSPSGSSLVLTFLALLVLVGVSWGAAALGAGTGVALAIAAVKAGLIALVFMELYRADAVDRIIAAVAVLLVVLLCAGALADVALR